jgi:hypothetical protein
MPCPSTGPALTATGGMTTLLALCLGLVTAAAIAVTMRCPVPCLIRARRHRGVVGGVSIMPRWHCETPASPTPRPAKSGVLLCLWQRCNEEPLLGAFCSSCIAMSALAANRPWRNAGLRARESRQEGEAAARPPALFQRNPSFPAVSRQSVRI